MGQYKYRISKSNFLSFLQCPKKFYLEKFCQNLLPELSPEDKFIMDMGYKIEAKAYELFNPEESIEVKAKDQSHALKRTRTLLSRGKHKNIFQPSFFAKYKDLGLFCRSDIVTISDSTEPKNVILREVKGSTSQKNVHVEDLAFQTFVLERAGFNVLSAELILIDRSYKRENELETKKLLKVLDITDDVREYLRLIPSQLDRILEIVEKDENPFVTPGSHCQNPFDCPAKKSICWPNESNVLTLSRTQKKYDFFSSGIEKIEELGRSEVCGLSEFNQRYIESLEKNDFVINFEKLERILSTLPEQYYVLDFESWANPFPFKGYRSYDQMVFQAHIGFFDGHKLHHYPCLEFNSTKEIDPAKAIARHLLEIISLDLPVIVYTSFEELRISDLINKYPDHKINLEKLKRNLWDLHEVFKDATVIHPSAEGKTSLKNIIKAFSKKSYSSLEINNGLAASAAYAELINPMTKSVTQRRIVRQLIEYNKFDVEATQIIIEGLFKLLRRKDG